METDVDAKRVLQAYIDGFDNDDADALAALFADNAIIEDPVGTPPKRGDEIRDWFHQGVMMRARLMLDAPIRGSHTRAAAMAFTVQMEVDGELRRVRSIDTIEINDEGLITCLRGYWGPDDTVDDR